MSMGSGEVVKKSEVGDCSETKVGGCDLVLIMRA